MERKDSMKKIDLAEAKSQISQMKYGLIYEISDVIFDRMDKIAEINWAELIEGYFFDDTAHTAQIHIYDTEEGLQAVCFTEPENARYVDKEYELIGKYQQIGKKVKKREYLEFDEDGQVYVSYTRLIDVIRGV